MDRIHHIAIQVSEIAPMVDWYRQHFDCSLDYQDNSWALIRFENLALALVMPGQHPPHIGIPRDDAERFGLLKKHRDGTASVYIKDPCGNALEILDTSSLKEPA